MKNRKIIFLSFLIFFTCIILVLVIYLAKNNSYNKVLDQFETVIDDYISDRYHEVSKENISDRLDALNDFYSKSYKKSKDYIDEASEIIPYFCDNDIQSSLVSSSIESRRYKEGYYIYKCKSLVYFLCNGQLDQSHYIEYTYTFIIDSEGKIDNLVRNNYKHTFVQSAEI